MLQIWNRMMAAKDFNYNQVLATFISLVERNSRWVQILKVVWLETYVMNKAFMSLFTVSRIDHHPKFQPPTPCVYPRPEVSGLLKHHVLWVFMFYVGLLYHLLTDDFISLNIFLMNNRWMLILESYLLENGLYYEWKLNSSALKMFHASLFLSSWMRYFEDFIF